MMSLSLYLGFVLAASVLMLIPGPNMALIVANSVAYGTRFGLLTLAGTVSAMVVQLALVAFGMAAAMESLGVWFGWVRWVGVAYLLFLGITTWRAPVLDLSAQQAQPRSARRIYLRGVLVSLTNPKTLFFYGAFFPQFIAPDAPLGPQLFVLSATFVVVAVTLDSGWALAAGWARPLLARHGRVRNRLTGGLMVGAGLGLAVAHRQ